MLKSIIDQLRAHRDQLDVAITSLEAVEADDPETWRGIARTYQPRRHTPRLSRPIVVGAKTGGLAASRPICGRPGCGKALGSNNTTGYCGRHWYDSRRKFPIRPAKKVIGRTGPRTAKERREMSARMKAAWASGKFKGRASKGQKVT